MLLFNFFNFFLKFIPILISTVRFVASGSPWYIFGGAWSRLSSCTKREFEGIRIPVLCRVTARASCHQLWHPFVVSPLSDNNRCWARYDNSHVWNVHTNNFRYMWSFTRETVARHYLVQHPVGCIENLESFLGCFGGENVFFFPFSHCCFSMLISFVHLNPQVNASVSRVEITNMNIQFKQCFTSVERNSISLITSPHTSFFSAGESSGALLANSMMRWRVVIGTPQPARVGSSSSSAFSSPLPYGACFLRLARCQSQILIFILSFFVCIRLFLPIFLDVSTSMCSY